MSTRKEILYELGLVPTWKLRSESTDIESEISELNPDQEERCKYKSTKALNGSLETSWAMLKGEISNCQRCALSQTRAKVVEGVGDQQASWMFIGEGPGAEEDAIGEPFVGRAGKLLDNMLLAMGLRRDENVYITNVVKCRPPKNRNPEQMEVEACADFLDRQIELLKPKVIVALGRFAADRLVGKMDTLSAYRGPSHTYLGIPVIVTYHPAYLLRNQLDKSKAWGDLCLALDVMDQELTVISKEDQD